MAEDLDREAMLMACLDARNRVTCLLQIALGLVIKIVFPRNAVSMITVHNHPSGDPQPSRKDRRFTAQVRGATETLGIKFLDQLIVGDGAYYSFADRGGC